MSPVPVKELQTLPLDTAPKADALATVDPMLAMIERLATNADVDVDKFERLVALQERGLNRHAEEQFNIAMSEAQKEMRPIAADAENPQTRSRYASYAKLDRVLRPIYTKHGFALSFDTGDAPAADCVRMLCYVTHIAGHSRTYKADMPADGKGAKGGDVMTKTHATGSAMAYGMRYLEKMIFNVAVGEDDDDGNAAGQKEYQPAAIKPKGYDEWVIDLSAVADEGEAKLRESWNRSLPQLRNYMTKHDAATWAGIKGKALQVKS